METRTYDSPSVPNLKVDVANYITEIILSRQGQLPGVPFWTKDHKDKYKDLCTKYVAELTQVKKLLKVFSPTVVAKYVKENKVWSLRMVKKERVPYIIFDLFSAQLAYINTLDNIDKAKLELLDDKVGSLNMTPPPAPVKSKISKGL